MAGDNDLSLDNATDFTDPGEQQRQKRLDHYEITDTEAEEAFDRLTQLASTFYQSPIALVSLIDKDRQWFKSRVGLDAEETPRNIAFCHHAIKQDDTFIVNDATQDPRFSANPLVTGAPDIRFYAGAPLTTSDGYKIGTLCIIDTKPREEFGPNDTEQLKALADIVISEMELRIKNRELETLNVELERALRAKKDFMSMISHEIRNPLGAVVSLAEAMDDFELDTDQKDLVKGLQSSSRVLMGLLNDILDYSKIEAGKISINRRKVKLAPIVQNIRSAWSQAAQEKGIELRVNISGDLPKKLYMDELRVTQVFNNLLSNAIKFTTKGHVALTIDILPNTINKTTKNMVKVRVQDTGIGMSEEQLSRLFVPFEQATSDIATQYGGTGLGMTITKRLVDLMEGEIHVSSEDGKGTCFEINVPLHTPEKDEDRSAEVQPLKSLRILAVDDVPINLVIATHLAGSLGHIVETAANGTDAIKMAQKAQYDLVLMDMRMPDMNGLEASRQILAHAPNLKIFALTAEDDEDARVAEKATGLVDFIIKPLTVEALEAVISQHF